MLYAKSGDPPYPLKEHTLDVIQSLKKLRLIWHEIPEILEKAAIFHDFGKATIGFQESILKNSRWGFRHEVLSAAIFRNCYDISDRDVWFAYISLLTHHKNLGSNTNISDSFQLCRSSFNPNARWYQKWGELQHEELRKIFPTELSHWVYDKQIQSPANDVAAYIQQIENVFDDMKIATMRGALIAADHIASSRICEPLEGHNISKNAIELYATENIKNWQGWSYIQKQAEIKATKGSALLIAPTGTGKTEAAILWALKNRKGGERIFYVLPYQVSINSMAERLSKMFPSNDGTTKLYKNKNVSILHSNTALAYLQDSLNDEIEFQKAVKISVANREAAHKIYSPIKVTTAYQLLNIFFGRKFFEVGLLELTNSVIIFDEIHAYDGHTLGLILVMLKYLKKLNSKIFIMTATLPIKLKEQLRVAAEIQPSQEIILNNEDPLIIEERRKLIAIDILIENDISNIKHTIEIYKEKKIVVVCNTVSKAIKIWEELKDYKPLLIHSRFTLEDRNKRESKNNIENQRVVISTQVIEVSLDVSFDIMFTELAPADCLLQRVGRVNRHGLVDLSNLGQCFIYTANDKGSNKVYDPEVLHTTKTYIPTSLLNFNTACSWIESVYPGGLSKEQQSMQENARKNFEYVVSQLKPMIDNTLDVNVEETLVNTVELIPLEYENEWRDRKQNGEHMLARLLIVNISYPSWRAALYKYRERYSENGYRTDRVTDKYKEHIIARFRYYSESGLRLDETIPPWEDESNFL